MADFEVSINFTGDAESAKDAAKATKDHIDKATDSVSILSDLIGVKIPDSVSKMIASSELVGPALEAAFAPLAIISLGIAIADVADKASKFAGELIYDTKALQGFENQIKADNKILEDYARKTKEATRALQLLNAPDEKAKNALKLQFQIEDQGGSAQYFADQLKAKQKELADYMKSSIKTAFGDAATGMQTDTEELAKFTKEGEEHIAELEHEINLLGAKQKEAAAAEALTAKQNEDSLKRATALHAAAAAQRQAIHNAAVAPEQNASTVRLQQHSKILTAKQQENNATKEQISFEQLLAMSNLANVQSAKQQADFNKKSAENEEKIVELKRDIQDKQAEHNAALQIALGYTTQEKADQQALATLEKNKTAALTESNSRIAAQDALIKQLNIDTMNGMLGSPAQKAALQQALLEWQKLKIAQLNLEKKYDDQIAGLQLKLANTSTAQIRKQMLEWQDIHKEMTNQFMSSLNSMNQSLVNFVVTGKGNWKNLATGAIESMVSMVLKYEESKIIMEILDALGLAKKKATNAAQAGSATGAAAANALASVPFPANIAAAATVQAQGQAYTAEAISLDVGTNYVPMDGLAYLHKGEQVIPEGAASPYIAQGGIGHTINVNFGVQAVDASSFQQHIRRHSNMIANEVTRALKRKA